MKFHLKLAICETPVSFINYITPWDIKTTYMVDLSPVNHDGRFIKLPSMEQPYESKLGPKVAQKDA